MQRIGDGQETRIKVESRRTRERSYTGRVEGARTEGKGKGGIGKL